MVPRMPLKAPTSFLSEVDLPAVKKSHKLGETNNFRNKTPRGGKGGEKRRGENRAKDITTITSFDNFDGAESSSSVNWLRAEVGMSREGRRVEMNFEGMGREKGMPVPPRRGDEGEDPPRVGTTPFSVGSWEGDIDTPQNDTPVDPNSLANYSPARGGLNRPDVEFSLTKEMKREIRNMRTGERQGVAKPRAEKVCFR